MPGLNSLTTDDFIQFLTDDGFEPDEAIVIAESFGRSNGVDAYWDIYQNAPHKAVSSYAADNHNYPDKPGTNKTIYDNKLKKRIQTTKGNAKQQAKTRRRVIKALKTKMKKRLAKQVKADRRALRIGCPF